MSRAAAANVAQARAKDNERNRVAARRRRAAQEDAARQAAITAAPADLSPAEEQMVGMLVGFTADNPLDSADPDDKAVLASLAARGVIATRVAPQNPDVVLAWLGATA